MKYPYGKIEKLREALEVEGVSETTIGIILQGGDKINNSTNAVTKAEWLKGAMYRLAEQIQSDRIQKIREACACCKGGLRNKLSKAIYKNNPDLASRLKAANETRFVFGHSVKQLSEGVFEVCYFAENARLRCPCLPQAEGGFPVSYCMCCGGHVKHHLQNALGIPLQVKVKHTALTSNGSQPCTFVLSKL